ncbi:uncharacterized protein LOC121368093 [Gigantopelta aegis]|uniref:uncharacterized protein LOC121368093 n=1 Tax=Gigantopelta aegis TaxID=1735272 RepID=UPI001B88D155|nr:uncharacterized protein LOC121368093 [Gigantopelta aegis]
MEVLKILFAVCLSVLLLGQLVTANPVFLQDEYVTGTEVQLADEISRALVKLMADINRHTSKRSRPRRYVTFTIGSDYYKRRPRRRHHRRVHPSHPSQSRGNQLVSQ